MTTFADFFLTALKKICAPSIRRRRGTPNSFHIFGFKMKYSNFHGNLEKWSGTYHLSKLQPWPLCHWGDATSPIYMEELVMCTIMHEDWGIPKIKGLSSHEHLFQECPTPWPLAWHKAPQQKIFTFSFFS